MTFCYALCKLIFQYKILIQDTSMSQFPYRISHVGENYSCIRYTKYNKNIPKHIEQSSTCIYFLYRGSIYFKIENENISNVEKINLRNRNKY